MHASFGFVVFLAAAAGIGGSVTGIYVAGQPPGWLPLRADAAGNAGSGVPVFRPLPVRASDSVRPAPPAKVELASIEPALPSSEGLRMPIEGLRPEQLHDTFTENRSGGRRHDAIDILAPEGTPVQAVVEGRVVKLFNSAAGGLTVYQFDRDEKFSYYYAHLSGYAAGLAEGQVLRQGEILGYVGHTGNASPLAPHLHFAITRLNEERQWWKGEPLNPYPLLVSGTAPG